MILKFYNCFLPAVRKSLQCIVILSMIMIVNGQENNPMAKQIDSLSSVIKNRSKDDTVKAKLYNNLGVKYLEAGEFDKAIEIIQKSVVLSEKLNFKNGLSVSFNNLGISYDYKSDYIKSLDYYSRALSIRKELNDQKGISQTYSNMAIVYEFLGKLPEALKAHYNALTIDEKLGNKDGIGMVNINIGSVLVQQKKYKEAKECLEKARRSFLDINSQRGLAYVESAMGTVYMFEQNFVEAEKYTASSCVKFNELNDKISESACFITLSQILFQNKKYDEGEKILKKVIRANFEMEDLRGLSMSYLALANIYSAKKKHSDARHLTDTAIIIAKNIGCMTCLKDAYSYRSQIDSAAGDYRGAFLHLKSFLNINDSLVNQENNKKSEQAKLQYDFDKKAIADSLKNIEIKNREQFKHEEEIHRQKMYSYGGFLGFVLMVVIAGLSFRAYQQKQKSNIIIAQQKAMVEEKQKEILDSIKYAQRIQQSLLPTDKYIERNLKNKA